MVCTLTSLKQDGGEKQDGGPVTVLAVPSKPIDRFFHFFSNKILKIVRLQPTLKKMAAEKKIAAHFTKIISSSFLLNRLTVLKKSLK